VGFENEKATEDELFSCADTKRRGMKAKSNTLYRSSLREMGNINLILHIRHISLARLKKIACLRNFVVSG
jgi:hypothetical protein